jgi:predicted RND superfamily exporter protein
MSEIAPLTPEKQEAGHIESLDELRHELAERPELAEHANPEAAEKQVEAARSDVETAAEQSDADKVRQALSDAEKPTAVAAPQYTNRELRSKSLREELKRLQQREKAPTKAFSKLVHQSAVRVVSETTAKSLTRPSGLLGGGIMAFVGTAAYVYFTKHIGLQYNYFVFIALFIGGFLLGLGLELIVWLAGSRKRASN